MMRHRPHSVICLLMALLLMPSAAFSQKTNTLDTLKTQYEVVRQKIESDALAAYSNALVTVGNQLKQKGDVDGYVVLQAEQTFLAKKQALPESEDRETLVGKLAGLDVLLKKIEDCRNAQIGNLLKQYISVLEVQAKQLLMADKVEDAKAAAHVRKVAECELAELTSRLPKAKESDKDIGATGGRRESRQPNAKYPSVAGTWRETRPNAPWSGAKYKITQSNGEVKCKGSFPKPAPEFDGEGTISESGEVVMRVRFVNAPPGWVDNTVKGRLSENGLNVEGKTTWAYGSCDIVWHKSDDSGVMLKNARSVTIHAEDERGSSLGPVTAGTKLILRYESGKWTGNNSPAYPRTSPDDANNSGQLAVYAVERAGDQPLMLVAVPSGTAEDPFEYEFAEPHSKIILRIADRLTLADNAGSVKYSYTLIPPQRQTTVATRPTSAQATPEASGSPLKDRSDVVGTWTHLDDNSTWTFNENGTWRNQFGDEGTYRVNSGTIKIKFVNRHVGLVWEFKVRVDKFYDVSGANTWIKRN